MFEQLTLDDSVLRVLASSVLAPGLRTILLIDASYAQLNRAAQILQQMLESAAGATVERMDLSPTDTDDTLWGIPFFPGPEAETRFVWKGKLSGGRETKQHILVIPDLAQLSLSAARGCAMAAGADVVHLERHAQHAYWQPRNYWLAACAEQDIGKVSLHLLERFALRINMTVTTAPNTEERIQALLNPASQPAGKLETMTGVPESDLMLIQQAASVWPVFSREASERVSAYFPPPFSIRRCLSLGRLATAEAALHQADAVLTTHVDQAAEMIGLRLPFQPASVAEPQQEPKSEGKPAEAPPAIEPATSGPSPSQIAPSGDDSGVQSIPVFTPDATAALPDQKLQLTGTNPYPEDHVAPEREAFALRLPLTQKGSNSRTQGPSTGVEKARDLRDLALAATLFEAAKFWVVRRQSSDDRTPCLEIRRSDLRQHRRLPAPESLLVLVMDYTSLRNCAWEDALLPHLEWAYTSRAAVALIRVGAKDTENELRADRVLARSLLAPEIGAALEVEAGRATPLAHGLELALQTLLHAIQHGRSAVVRARLVVLTDGRGNVPLAASRTGKIAFPVRREGIEDALRAAEGLRTLSHLETVFLDPQPSHHAELPAALANALGAQPVGIPQRPDADSTAPAPDKEAAR